MEHWVSGGVEDHGPNEDGYHATVRSHTDSQYFFSFVAQIYRLWYVICIRYV